MVAKIGKAFPGVVVDGVVDRVALGNAIFSDAAKRALLNRLTHPAIFKNILWRIFDLKILKGKKIVVLDAPLLFESKVLEYFCFPIIVVYCDDKQKQVERLMLRNNIGKEEAN